MALGSAKSNRFLIYAVFEVVRRNFAIEKSSPTNIKHCSSVVFMVCPIS